MESKGKSADRHNLASLFDLANPAQKTEERPLSVAPEPVFPPVEETIVETTAGFRLGTKVRHIKFGIGTVRRLEGAGDKQKVTVYFNSVGPKKLLLKFAGLMPV